MIRAARVRDVFNNIMCFAFFLFYFGISQGLWGWGVKPIDMEAFYLANCFLAAGFVIVAVNQNRRAS